MTRRATCKLSLPQARQTKTATLTMSAAPIPKKKAESRVIDSSERREPTSNFLLGLVRRGDKNYLTSRLAISCQSLVGTGHVTAGQMPLRSLPFLTRVVKRHPDRDG